MTLAFFTCSLPQCFRPSRYSRCANDCCYGEIYIAVSLTGILHPSRWRMHFRNYLKKAYSKSTMTETLENITCDPQSRGLTIFFLTLPILKQARRTKPLDHKRLVVVFLYLLRWEGGGPSRDHSRRRVESNQQRVVNKPPDTELLFGLKVTQISTDNATEFTSRLEINDAGNQLEIQNTRQGEV